MSGADRRWADRREPSGGQPQAARKPPPGSRTTNGILALQATVGNRVTARLVQQLAGDPAPGRYVAVQRDLTTVEKELKRRFADPDDPGLVARRAALRAQVGRLNEQDSSDLVTLLLQAPGNNAFTDRFQTLSASTRYELLTALFGRLGHLGAELFAEPLTSDTDLLGYQARFRRLIPDQQLRRKLVTILSGQFAAAHQQAPANRTLWVNWDEANFRTSGGFSLDNDAQQTARRLGFSQLGIQSDPRSGQNAMELRGDVVGHTAGTVYDIKQTIEKRNWKLVGKRWVEQEDEYLPPGTDDDWKGNSDEDLTPDPAHPHVYLFDGPGVVPDPDIDRAAVGYVYSATFVTWVIAKKPGGGWERVSTDFEWHSNSTMQKINGRGVRGRAGRNNISFGPQPLVEPTP